MSLSVDNFQSQWADIYKQVFAKSIKVVPDRAKRLKPSAKSTMGMTDFNSGMCQTFYVDTEKNFDRDL